MPAFLNVTDIAGLVKGASEGQGLGNAFLSHIRVSNSIPLKSNVHWYKMFREIMAQPQICTYDMVSQACDAMFHLCRTFEDPDITHVEGDVSAA